MSLNERQKAFADYYIELGNAEAAARKAGYSDKYARGQAYKLLANVGIKTYIEERVAEKDAKKIAKQDEVLEFLTKVMRGEVTEEVPILIGEGVQELQDKDIAAKDRIKAAELIGKRYVLWTEKTNFSGDLGISVKVDYGDDE